MKFKQLYIVIDEDGNIECFFCNKVFKTKEKIMKNCRLIVLDKEPTRLICKDCEREFDLRNYSKVKLFHVTSYFIDEARNSFMDELKKSKAF